MSHFIRKAPQTLTLVALLLAPAFAAAAHPDIARLATQLNLATGQMAYELRGSGAYAVIRQRADRLSREAADLVDAIRRDRSRHRVQSHYVDVKQRFASLEQAFLRLHRRDYDSYVFAEFDRISRIYSNLSSQFHYDDGYAYRSPIVLSPPVIVRQYRPPQGYSKGYVERPYFGQPDSHNYQPQPNRRDRRDYERRQVQRLPDFDHLSPVLERQHRLDSRRHGLQRTPRRDNTETRRRNHYQ